MQDLGERVAGGLQDVVRASRLELLDWDGLRVKAQHALDMQRVVLAVLKFGLHRCQYLPIKAPGSESSVLQPQ